MTHFIQRLGARLATLTAIAAAVTACSSEGSGDVALSIWGEEYIEEGIPAAEFEDGGSAVFTKFVIAIGTVTLADTAGGTSETVAVDSAFDLVTPGPHAVGSLTDLAATTHDAFDYHVVPASATTAAHASTSAADLQAMVSEGWSILVEGTFTSGTDTKSFRWGFSEATHYAGCVDVSSGQDLAGVVVVDGARSEAQLTIHGDHFFYDDLLSSDAKLRTEALALGDADMDGEVTLDELDAVTLASLSSELGPYGVAASDVNTLGAYVRAATRTLGHFNGEGHCEVHSE